MEDHLSSCLGNILKFDLSLITDLLKTHKTLAELTPNITRSCLGILKEEMSAVLEDPRRKDYGTGALELCQMFILTVFISKKAGSSSS